MLYLRLLLLSLLANVWDSVAVSLSPDKYSELTGGKTVFIKFFAPWCGHCKEMAPQWSRLSKEWANHKQGLVAEVDCTKEEKWCSETFDITAFPTLMFGDPSDGGLFLQKYEGDKTYEALSTFANDTLRNPVCSPANTVGCDELERARIEKAWQMSTSEIESTIRDKESAIKEAKASFKRDFSKMQEVYDEVSLDYEILVSSIKRNLDMLESVRASISQM